MFDLKLFSELEILSNCAKSQPQLLGKLDNKEAMIENFVRHYAFNNNGQLYQTFTENKFKEMKTNDDQNENDLKPSFLLQHPMSVESMLTMGETTHHKIEPNVILSLPLAKNDITNKIAFNGIILNQESILTVGDIVQTYETYIENTADNDNESERDNNDYDKNDTSNLDISQFADLDETSNSSDSSDNGESIAKSGKKKYYILKKYKVQTHHGIAEVPELFHSNPIFFGGDDSSTVEVLTTSRFCRGVSLFNGRLFWNPDLKTAAALIRAGHCDISDFKFFYGKVKWDYQLWENIQNRNIFSQFQLSRKAQPIRVTQLVREIFYFYSNKNHDLVEKDMVTGDVRNMWLALMRISGKNFRNWIELSYLINSCPERMQKLRSIQFEKVKNQSTYFLDRYHS